LGTSTAQKTSIGLIISGPIGIAPCNVDKAQVSLCISVYDTNSLLRKFDGTFWRYPQYIHNAIDATERQFGRMKRFLRKYLLKKRTNNVRDILSPFTLAQQKVET
jgi:hypothetical protein